MNYTLVRGGVELNLVQVLVSYCNNASLQAFYPNLTCKTREETNAVVPFTSFLSATLEQFFDISNFEEPLKYNLKSDSSAFTRTAKSSALKIEEHYAVLKNSWLHSS